MVFEHVLARWYEKNKRDLPWRKTKDPYPVWISEIILQQTRIIQGKEYYLHFLERFPGIRELAEADEEEVLKLWQGLGYYSRARNLHTAAREIMTLHGGVFPPDYHNIRNLKGIGDYTAAAIASISFNLPYPVVDGNVLRFLTRYKGIQDPVDTLKGKSAVLEVARQYIPEKNPGDFNQALMEFGALQCIPGVPDCNRCPFHKTCFAFLNQWVARFPVKSKKPQQRNRYFHYLVMVIKGKQEPSILLNKRTGDDIWKNLFDFPLIETGNAVSLKKLMTSPSWKEIMGSKPFSNVSESGVHKHILSHQVIHAKFYIIGVTRATHPGFLRVPVSELGKFPVPRLIEQYLKTFRLQSDLHIS
jgi:A/G-specific adenine glycosylase